MYKDVDAVTDIPANIWYEEILQAFPDAKVILSVRDSEDAWLKSFVRENDEEMLSHDGFLVRWLLRNCSCSGWQLTNRIYRFVQEKILRVQ